MIVNEICLKFAKLRRYTYNTSMLEFIEKGYLSFLSMHYTFLFNRKSVIVPKNQLNFNCPRFIEKKKKCLVIIS